MRARLELAYEYRRLLARCRSEAGLEMAEIQELAAAEAQLVAAAGEPAALDLPVMVRGGKADDRVRLISIGPTSMSLAACPYLEPGTKVEIVIEDDERSQTYRFKALVIALEDAADDLYGAALELIGAPLLLRRRPRTVELVAEAA